MGFLQKLRKKQQYGPVKTFTYFIPAPPSRKSGYREKNFDQIIEKLTDIGFEIVDIRTQSISHQDQGGMWIILSIRPKTKAAQSLKASDFPNEFVSQDTEENSHVFSEEHLNSSLPSKDQNEKFIDLPEDQAEEDTEGVKGIYYIE